MFSHSNALFFAFKAFLPICALLVSVQTVAGVEPGTAGKQEKLPLYSLPYSPGEEYIVGQGYNQFPTHEGTFAIDWIMPEGTPIRAVQKGTIVEVIDHFTEHGLVPEMYNRGNQVILQHDDGAYTLYHHLAPQGAKVKVGQRVEEGEVIALSGNTGFTDTPHLHFMAYRLVGGQRESFPMLFKSGRDDPFFIAPEAKYLAPGGKPKPDEGPLKGIQGTGELSSIRPKIVQLVRETDDLAQAAEKFRADMKANASTYHKLYIQTWERAKTGDKTAMRELQEFLDTIDLHADQYIARLRVDPQSAEAAEEAMMLWWGLTTIP